MADSKAECEPSNIKGCPSRADLSDLCKLLAKDYSPLFRELRLSDADIDSAEIDFKDKGVREINYQLLRMWTEVNGSAATKSWLIQALVNVGKRSLVENVFPDEIIPEPTKPLPVAELWQNEELTKGVAAMKKNLILKWQNICLPPLVGLKRKVLPLDKLFIDLQMYIKTELGDETEGQEIKLGDIFDEVHGIEPTRLLIEGDPGYGKTTLVWKLLSDFGKGMKYLAKFDFVFPVNLRNFEGDLEKSMCDVITLQNIHNQQIIDIIQKYDRKILLILDGYDELKLDLKENLLPLLRGSMFPLMTVIITSRPGQFRCGKIPLKRQVTFGDPSLNAFDSFWEKRIEICGITPENREKFLENYFHKDVKTILEKISYWQCREIYNLLICPLFLLLIAETLAENDMKSFQSKTELYKKVVKFQVTNLHREPELHSKETCSGEIDSRFQFSLLEFSNLAFQMLKDSVLFTDEAELSKFVKDKDDFLQLGFLVKYISFSKFTEIENYEIVHKSFLDYFAAFHLANDKSVRDVSDKIADLMKKGVTPTHNTLFYSFFLGLLENKLIFFEALAAWNFKYCFNHMPFADICLERVLLLKDVDFTKSFIPSLWSIDRAVPNRFRLSNSHKNILIFGLSRNIIKILKWDLCHLANLPDYVKGRYTFILDISKMSTEHMQKCLQYFFNKRNNRPDLINKKMHCGHLICRFHYYSEEIWHFVIQMLHYMSWDQISFNVKRDQTCLLPLRLKDAFEFNAWHCIQYLGICVNLRDDQETFQAIVDMITNNKLAGLGLILINNARDCCDTEFRLLNGLVNKAAMSVSLEELAIELKSGHVYPLNLELLYNSGQKNWKKLSFHGDIELDKDEGTQSYQVDHVMFPWKRKYHESDSRMLASCSRLKYLKCDMVMLKSLCSNVTKGWLSFKSLKHLELLLINNTFKSEEVIDQLREFSHLSNLSFDLGDLRDSQTILELASSLVKTFCILTFEDLSIKRIDDRQLKFVERILHGINSQFYSRKMKQLMLKFTCKAGHEMKNCLFLVRELLKKRVFAAFYFLDPLGYENLLFEIFLVDGIFTLQRTVEEIQSFDVLFNRKDLTYPEYVTESICVFLK